jgi:signal transduction histidine kinase
MSEPRHSVLLVDDVPELRRLLRHVLEWSERFAVVAEADNGLDAIKLTEEHRPDLVLLDVSMPVMDGMQALPRIRAASPSTRVVVLSGFEAERLAESAMAEGASAYLEKGIPPALLVSQLLAVVGASAHSPRPQGAPEMGQERAPVLDVSPEEMMSLVAHEIRNPLAVIQGFGTELQNRWDTMPDEQRLDAVRRMTERARYLNTLVNNLMYMRRLESGVLGQEPTPHDVGLFLEAVSDELRELARGHPLRVQIPDDLSSAYLDMIRLRQVLTNLVVNAARFSPSAEPIDVSAGADEEGIVIRVADKGPGIPAAFRESVFDKFKRLDQSGSGIGLGLFISRSLMMSMGGSLSIDDSDEGAVFAVRLRAAQ